MFSVPFVQRVLLAARLKGHELPTAPLPGGGFDPPNSPRSARCGASRCSTTMAGHSPNRRDRRLSRRCAGRSRAVADGPVRAGAGVDDRAADRERDSRPTRGRSWSPGCSAREPETQAITDGGAGADRCWLRRARTGAGRQRTLCHRQEPEPRRCLAAPVLALWDIIDPVVDSRADIDARPGIAAYFAMAERDPVPGEGIRTMRRGFTAITVEQAVARPAHGLSGHRAARG